MALRAKKPVIPEKPRIKVVLYSEQKVGKSHFCCSIPDSYYIDTENLGEYPHFMKMLAASNSDYVCLREMHEILAEVKALLTTEHHYKTVIIDSLSMAAASLDTMEVERLANPRKGTEGTEFGANKAKSARLTQQLTILLTRLDMNVIVVSHAKDKYVDNEMVGQTWDINKNMVYGLGALWHMRRQGDAIKLFVEGSRYPEMEKGKLFDFNNGYEVLKNIFGEEIFLRDVKKEELASPEQVEHLQRLIAQLDIDEAVVQKWLTKAQSLTLSDMSSTNIEACIKHLLEKLEAPKAKITNIKKEAA